MTSLVALRRFLLAASGDVPVPVLLAALRVARRFIPIANLPVRKAGTDVFGLDGEPLRELCQRSWWGSKASDVLCARLEIRPQDVFNLIDIPDEVSGLGSVERTVAAGRGVILAGAHVGPAQLAASLVYQRFPTTLFLREHAGWRGQGQPTVIPVQDRGDRARVLKLALAHLKGGGVVYATPDGRSMEHTVDVPLRNGLRPMARGIAALARLSGARTLPLAVGWAGRRLRLLVGGEITPAPGPAQAWEMAWLTAYVTCVDRWSCLAAENLPAHGGLYEWFKHH